MRARPRIVLGCFCAVLAACGGGSGSTGLVTSESSVIDDVRRDGTCDSFDGAPYCATDSPDATAPGGQRVSVLTPVPTPVRTGTPGSIPTGTPGLAPTPTPSGGSAPTRTAAVTASPAPTATPAAARSVTLLVEGFEAGAACATAARSAESDGPWKTATLVPVDSSGAAVTFPLPIGIPAPSDVALLCFEDPPAVLPAELATLTDADPTVVFVLPSS